MTTSYADRYRHLLAQRAYTRAVAVGGVCELLRPYSVRVPVVPLQRRRVVRSEVTA